MECLVWAQVSVEASYDDGMFPASAADPGQRIESGKANVVSPIGVRYEDSEPKEVGRVKKLLFGLLIVASLIAATGCSEKVTDTTGLIPREVLFSNSDESSVQLSADEPQTSYLAPVDPLMNVWVGPADDTAAGRSVR